LERVRQALPRDGARPARAGGSAPAVEPGRAARRRLGARVPLVACRHDLLRLLRGPTQHHREARPRPAPGLIGSGEMRFELSEDGALARSHTRDYFPKDAPLERSRRIMEHDARGFEAPQWRQLAEMGYLGLTVPAEQGGQGLGAVELAVVCEEAGRVCLPG